MYIKKIPKSFHFFKQKFIKCNELKFTNHSRGGVNFLLLYLYINRFPCQHRPDSGNGPVSFEISPITNVGRPPSPSFTDSRSVTFTTTCQDNVIKWHPFVILERRAGNVDGVTWRRCDCAARYNPIGVRQ